LQIGLLLLNLEGNGLGDDGLALLCPGLARNASLLEVNLADNQIGGRPDALHGITEFAQVVSGCPPPPPPLPTLFLNGHQDREPYQIGRGRTEDERADDWG